MGTGAEIAEGVLWAGVPGSILSTPIRCDADLGSKGPGARRDVGPLTLAPMTVQLWHNRTAVRRPGGS